MIFRIVFSIDSRAHDVREFFHADESKGFAKCGRIMHDMSRSFAAGAGEFTITTRVCDPNNVQV